MLSHIWLLFDGICFHCLPLNINNENITDPSLMCNVFNKYFCNIGDTLVNKLPQKGDSISDFLDYCNPSLLSSMLCDTVDQN